MGLCRPRAGTEFGGYRPGRTPSSLSDTFVPMAARAHLVWLVCIAVTAGRSPAQDLVPPTSTVEEFPAPPQGRVDIPSLLRFQSTLILQALPAYRSPTEGPSTLIGDGSVALSHTSTMFLGIRPTPWFETFVNAEIANGKGVGGVRGAAGFPNGDVIRNPQVGQQPYFARYFLRFTAPLGPGVETAERGDNVIPGERATERLVFSAGKVATVDFFDVNSYANSARTQFLNWSLLNNAAYDYAADTRGYTGGLVAEWITPDWSVRFGSFLMPDEANGTRLAWGVRRNRGDNLEFELHPALLGDDRRTVIRFMGYRNLAAMGNYREALARANGGAPDITSTRRPGAVKYGGGISLEQPLSDDGTTGLFARAAWNDGATESFAYTEAEFAVSAGVQIGGAHWGRPDDRVGLAYAQNELGADHRDYLRAGGVGFLLGDSGLRTYAPERIFEAYYSMRALDFLWLSTGYQLIANPGYNADRGPASVITVRAHLVF